MFLNNTIISATSNASEIVRQNYHTAEVFHRYKIEYCCGGRWPLATVCDSKRINFAQLKKELEAASRIVHVSPSLPFHNWDVDFLTSYIVNVHHYFLRNSMPITIEMINHFVAGHEKQFPFMRKIYVLCEQLQNSILPHIQYEEETIFPYVCQVAHAYHNKDTYAKLLVKTLRKPLGSMVGDEHHLLKSPIIEIRGLTNNYTIPETACVSHRLVLSRLKELDNDLMQHLYLENEILFPNAMRIEVELLQ